MHAQEFLGLQATHNPHRWYLPVERKLCTRQGFLFGGCGLAAAVAALETTAARPLVWATAQYLSYARTPACRTCSSATRSSTPASWIASPGWRWPPTSASAWTAWKGFAR